MNLSSIFKNSKLPGYCQALIWIGSFGWGLSLFLACASTLKFEYRPFQGIIATPAFLLYPEQKDFWLYILALTIVPSVTIFSYLTGRVITSFLTTGSLTISSATFLLGWLMPLGYAYKPSVDWVLLAFSLALFVAINWIIYLQRTVDLSLLTFWLFSGAAIGIAGLTSPFADMLRIRQHPLAFLLLCVGLGGLGYFLLRGKKRVQTITLALSPLWLLPLHSLLWSVVYQGNREVLRQGSVAFALVFDGVLVFLGLLIGLAFVVLSGKWRCDDNYIKVLKGFLVYLVIPILLYILAYNPNIHGPLDLFHEGERLSPAFAIAQGKAPYKEVVFIHGFLRDPGIGLAAFKIFGYSVAGLRALERLIFPLVIVFSYYLALICLNFEIAILYSLLTLMGFWPFFYDWRMVPLLFFLLILLAFIDKQARFLPLLAGFGVGLTLLTSVDMGIVGLAVGFAFFGVFSVSVRRADAFMRFLASFGLCLLGLMIWLNQAGLLTDCLKWNLHLLQVNSHWNGMPFPYPLDTWAKGIKALLSPVASMVAIIVLGVKWCQREWENRCWVIFVLLIANITLYNRTIVGGQLYSSHIQDGSHFAPILLMVVLLLERKSLSRHLLYILLTGALLIPTPLSGGRTLLGLLGKLPDKNQIRIPEDWVLSEIPQIGPIFLPSEQNLWVSELVRFLTSVDSFWDFTDHGLLYFLSAHPSPTRFYATHHIITIGDQQEVIAALEQARPSFVLYRSGTGWDAIAGIDRTVRSFLVSEYLLKNYHFFNRIGSFVILKRGAPDAFPQPLAFKVDLGYLPVLWAQNFSDDSFKELIAESILNDWQPNREVRIIDMKSSELKIVTVGSDSWLERNVMLNPRSAKYFLLRMRVSGPGEPKAQIFWRSDNEGFSEERSVTFNLLPDGKEHLYLIPLAPFPSWMWSDVVTSLRFDPSNEPSVELYITDLKVLYSQ